MRHRAGIYDLRLADAHFGDGNIESGNAPAGLDVADRPAMQGRRSIQRCVDTLQAIVDLLGEPCPDGRP